MLSGIVFALLALLGGAAAAAAGDFRFAAVLGDQMVLQRAPARANVWGFGATAGELVSVTLDAHPVGSAAADADGRWLVQLPATPVTERAHNLTAARATGGAVLRLSDVLFGDVWVCSGQSNMERPVDWANASQLEMAAAARYTDVRLFQVARLGGSTDPLDDLLQPLPGNTLNTWALPGDPLYRSGLYPGIGWGVGATPLSQNETAVGPFAASCWFFGRDLYDAVGVPLGLVLSSLGGTTAELWSSADALEKCPRPDDATAGGTRCDTNGAPGGGNCTGATLWNGMINPLLPLAIKGVVWYQGEANSAGSWGALPNSATTYNCTFPTMIDDWRAKWHAASKGATNATFPFGYVQLNSFKKQVVWPNSAVPGTNPLSDAGDFASLRWAQSAEHGFAPNARQVNTFMAVTMDTPYEDSVHSIYKQPTGARLAWGARAVAYGDAQVKAVGFTGPVPESVQLSTAGTVSVTFNGFDGYLEVRTEQGFEVYMGGAWHNAPIGSQSGRTVVLQGAWVGASHLRFLWADAPCSLLNCTLYAAGPTTYMLPASPFFRALPAAA